MIERIGIRGVASYSDDNEQIVEPKKVNFLFGLNGSGKTTISRYLASPSNEKYSKCQIEDHDPDLKYYVYNHDYVIENFSAETIPGVFTLGKDSIETKTKREQLTEEIKILNEIIDKKNKEIDGTDDSPGYQQRLTKLVEDYTNAFWKIKQSLDQDGSSLLKALSGVLANKRLFKEKLLSEYQNNKSELLDRKDLENQCKRLFDSSAEKVNPLPKTPQFEQLLSLEQDDILKMVIVGKENVAISELIQKLGNSAWFNNGRQYLEFSNGKCPFCQQKLPDNFAQQIEDYFDKTYETNIKRVSTLKENYLFFANQLESCIQSLVDSSNEFLDCNVLSDKFDILKKILNTNIERIEKKQLIPSSIVKLDSIKDISTSIKMLIQEANDAISKHNARIDNIKIEKEKLKSSVWKYIVTNLSLEINDYNRKMKEIQLSLDNANTEKRNADVEYRRKKAELHEVEKSLTSIIPTANGINGMLKKYGFTNFWLETDDVNKTYYFVRANNEPAFETLSEGERNFVTFLYYIYTLQGNMDESGHKDNKVLVIDDPVSSLDNDVLFLVSTLIRDKFESVYDDNNSEGIKQIFIFSHNLYFFKEVSFEKGVRKNQTGFWIVSKTNDVSTIKRYDDNPVSSTYEMLWDEVKLAKDNPANVNTASLANVMRRILEYYFKFLGGKDLNRFHRAFLDGDRQVFKSLISWVNAGSHSSFDDFSATPALYNTETFLKVFEELFRKTDHLSHYNMMMGIEENSNQTEETAHG